MILDLSSALKHPGQSFPFSVEGNIDDFNINGDEIKFLTPVKVEGSIMYTGSNFFVRGYLTIDYSTSCALCFKDVHGTVECDFNEEFATEEDISHPDRYTFIGKNIDITKMVNDNISLNLPVKHLCQDGCKGLCPTCGQNLNDASCNCDASIGESSFENETVMNKKENPFAVLKNLFNDEDEEAK